MNEINYEKAFVCYFDVLGFRSFIDNKERVAVYFNFITRAINQLIGLKLGIDFKYHLISDAVVFAIPINQENSAIQCLRGLLGQISILQYYLATNNIWIRGAVTYGEIGFATDNKFITGVALAQAYELEKLALYPRVIIDPRICNYLNTTSQDLIASVNLSGYEHENCVNWIYEKYDNKMLDRDYLFINFMVYASRGDNLVQDEIEQIYMHLKNNLLTLPEQNKKYEWVRKYICSCDDIKSRVQNFQSI